MNMTLFPYRQRNVFDDFSRSLVRDFFSNAVSENSKNECAVGGGANWAPAVDIQETDTHFLVKADVPGVDPKEIEVTVENGMLAIKGERKDESVTEDKGYKRVERSYGSFSRYFSLPETVDTDGIRANGKNGVLEISLPKQKPSQPKRIEIQ